MPNLEIDSENSDTSSLISIMSNDDTLANEGTLKEKPTTTPWIHTTHPTTLGCEHARVSLRAVSRVCMSPPPQKFQNDILIFLVNES